MSKMAKEKREREDERRGEQRERVSSPPLGRLLKPPRLNVPSASIKRAVIKRGGVWWETERAPFIVFLTQVMFL